MVAVVVVMVVVVRETRKKQANEKQSKYIGGKSREGEDTRERERE